MSLSRPVAARVVPFATFIAFVALAPLVPAGAWWTVARDLCVAALLVAFRREYVEILGAPRFSLREALAAAAVGMVVFLAWIASGWAMAPAHRGFDPGSEGGALFWPLAAIRLASIAITVPVMEELFWRSFLMRWIDRRDFLAMDPAAASLRAVVVCSALFAVEHSQWLAGLLAGLAYAAIYVRTRNILLSILAHAITNATLGLWILATGEWRFW
ncbi:MAG TPA: CAAX prenyl protease-related protein [Usitatibacter sp.]|nr:CAAX prenyl protease-related protein [Usitatibacter sp.]